MFRGKTAHGGPPMPSKRPSARFQPETREKCRPARSVVASINLDEFSHGLHDLCIDDDTVRTWRDRSHSSGMDGLRSFDVGGSARELDEGKIEALGEWIDETVPTSTRQIGAWLRQRFGTSYTRSGLVKLLAGIGFVFHKPQVVPRTIDAEAQRRFIAEYEALLNGLRPDEAVMFIDAVHPAHRSPSGWLLDEESRARRGGGGEQRTRQHQRPWGD